MRVRTRYGFCGNAALLVVAAFLFLGCNHSQPCADNGEAAIQATVPHLGPAVVSNLVREASQCIADAVADANAPAFYRPMTSEAPVAYGLRVEPPSQFSVGMGATVDVRTRGSSAPYMAVRVPLHVGPALCLWEVYVCVKPGGNFANDNPDWVVAEGSTNAAPVVALGDEVRLYAQLRNRP